MSELLDACWIDTHGIPLGIESSSGSRLGHLFRRISPHRCRGQPTEKGDDNYDPTVT